MANELLHQWVVDWADANLDPLSFISGTFRIPGSLALGQNAAHVRAPHETTRRA